MGSRAAGELRHPSLLTSGSATGVLGGGTSWCLAALLLYPYALRSSLRRAALNNSLELRPARPCPTPKHTGSSRSPSLPPPTLARGTRAHVPAAGLLRWRAHWLAFAGLVGWLCGSCASSHSPIAPAPHSHAHPGHIHPLPRTTPALCVGACWCVTTACLLLLPLTKSPIVLSLVL